MKGLNYFDKCKLLNANPVNPVILAAHFQHIVSPFFKEILLVSASPLGKLKYYAIRIELQAIGSPHVFFVSFELAFAI